MQNNKTTEARKVFETVCAMLDEDDIQYEKSEDELSVKFILRGNSIPCPYHISVDDRRELVGVHSEIPMKAKGDHMTTEIRNDLATAVSMVNYRMVNGSFGCDFDDGMVFFHMAMSYRDSEISKKAIEYMVYCSAGSIDEYLLPLTLLGKGKITLEKFLEDLE